MRPIKILAAVALLVAFPPLFFMAIAMDILINCVRPGLYLSSYMVGQQPMRYRWPDLTVTQPFMGRWQHYWLINSQDGYWNNSWTTGGVRSRSRWSVVEERRSIRIPSWSASFANTAVRPGYGVRRKLNSPHHGQTGIIGQGGGLAARPRAGSRLNSSLPTSSVRAGFASRKGGSVAARPEVSSGLNRVLRDSSARTGFGGSNGRSIAARPEGAW